VDALTIEQLTQYRDHLVPSRPVKKIEDVAQTLVVESDGTVVPLTHGVNRALRLGSLSDARLSVLARRWLDSGSADEMAEACERAWIELTTVSADAAVYWYEEVAARTLTASPVIPRATSSARN